MNNLLMFVNNVLNLNLVDGCWKCTPLGGFPFLEVSEYYLLKILYCLLELC
jgi:hypothetical protein